MEEKKTKRKTVTSTAVKARYNKKTYDRITICVPKEKAARFKEKCKEDGIPFSQVLKKALDDYLGE